MTKILYLRLKCIELILNTAEFTNADVEYWEIERRIVLKDIVDNQIATFDST